MQILQAEYDRLTRRGFLLSAAKGAAAIGLAGAGMGLADWTCPTTSAAGATSRKDGKKIKIAAIALATVDGMMEHNYARGYRLAEISAEAKPDIVLLPEAFAAGYCGVNLAPYAEDLGKSENLRKFRDLSRKAGCMVVLGFLSQGRLFPCSQAAGSARPRGPASPCAGMRLKIRNTVVIFDRGEIVGTHHKSSLWSDKKRPYRDEATLMTPVEKIDVFQTRFGRLAVLICYENMLPKNWDSIAGKVDLVLSPYNCEGDPSGFNISNAKRVGIASAWADRTGTVYAGNGYAMNPGTAGIVDADGKKIAHSPEGAEVIVTGELVV